MKKLLALILATTATGCATLKPVPTDQLQYKKVEQTNVSKSQAFNNAIVFLSKYIKDSNHAIKMKNEQKGRIIAKVNYTCDGLKRPDIIPPPSATDVNFNVDLSFKKNKMKFNLEMIDFIRVSGAGTWNQAIPQANGQKEAINECMNKLKTKILAAVKESPGDENW